MIEVSGNAGILPANGRRQPAIKMAGWKPAAPEAGKMPAFPEGTDTNLRSKLAVCPGLLEADKMSAAQEKANHEENTLGQVP
jgi:hypothetical protein